MGLKIGRFLYNEIINHLKSVYPMEGCGLLAGRDGRVEAHCPIDNVLNSATAFEMAPDQLIAAFMDFEAAGQRLQAIYHSHPHGPAIPSSRDVVEANYPEAVQIIVSFEAYDEPNINAFEIIEGRVLPITLTVV
jgi:proteasome lid subunit RPN8/RPN11